MNSLILCHLLLPYIIQPPRITSHSKSIIDNIFSNYISQEIVSGNLTSTISDHLPQFFIASHICSNAPNKNSNIFWSKFNREEFILDYFAIDWPHILKLQNNDTNTSFQNFFDSMSRILDKYAPLKKLSKYNFIISIISILLLLFLLRTNYLAISLIKKTLL